MKKLTARLVTGFLVSISGFIPFAHAQVTGIWNLLAGNWSEVMSPVPQATNDIAVLVGAPGASRLVTNDTSISLGGLWIGGTANNARVVTIKPLDGTTSITFTNLSGGSAFLVKTNNAGVSATGTDTIATPIILGSNLAITNLSTNGKLTLSGPIGESVAGRSITVDGPGITLSATNTFTGGVTANSGTLNINNALSLGGGTLTINNGATAATTISTTVMSNNIVINAGGLLKVGGNGYLAGEISGSGDIYHASNGAFNMQLRATNANFSGIITNAGTIGLWNNLSMGTGTLVLGDGINAGILAVRNGYSLTGAQAISNNIVLVGDTTNTFGSATSYQGDGELAGQISGTGSLTKNGTSTWILSGSNTYSGSLTNSAGTLIVAKTASLPGYNAANRVSVSSGATLAARAGGVGEWSGAEMDELLGATTAAFSSGSIFGIEVTTGNTFTYAGDLAGAQADKGFTKIGEGALNLSGTSTHTGGTTIRAGTLNLTGGNNQLAAAGAIAAVGGVFDLGGFSLANNSTVAFTGGTVQNGTLDKSGVNYDGQSGTVTAVLAGSAGLTKTTTGVLTLSGDNTYSGGTTNLAGTLALGHNNALGSGGLFIAGDSTVQSADTTVRVITNLVTFTTNKTLTVAGDADVVFLEMKGSASGAPNDIIANAAGRDVYIGNFDKTGGSLTKTGTGNVTITNMVSTGAQLNVSDGALAIGNGAAAILPSNVTFKKGGQFGFNGTFTRNYGNFVQYWSGGFFGWGTNAGFGGDNNLTFTSGTGSGNSGVTNLIWGSTNTVGYAGLALFDLTNVETGNGVLVLGNAMANGTVTYVNPIDFNGALREVRVNRSTNAAPGDVDAILPGTLSDDVVGAGGGLLKAGAGRLTISGTNTFTGGTIVTAGVLRVSGNAALGAPGAEITNRVVSGAGMELDGSGGDLTITTPSSLWLLGPGTDGTGALRNIAGNNTYAGRILIGQTNSQQGATIAADAGTVLTLAGTIDRIPGGAIQNVTFGGDGDIIVSGTIANVSGNAQMYKTGNGALTLSGTNVINSSVGGFNLMSGKLNANSEKALGSGIFRLYGGTLDNTSGGEVTLSNNQPIQIHDDFTFAGTHNLNLGNGAVTLGTNAAVARAITVDAGTLTIGGSITNGVTTDSLVKEGTGTLLLAGANVYTGTTTVNAGTLLVNGSLQGGLIVDDGGTLGGSGVVKDVTMNAGSILSPGNSPGTLTVDGDLTLNSGATNVFELGTASDKVIVTGTLYLNDVGWGNFNFVAGDGFGEATYTLFEAGALSGSLGGTTSGVIGGYNGQLAISGADLVLNVTAIPEPAVISLMTLIGAGMLLRRRWQAVP